MNLFWEIIEILAFSRRTQWALVFGILAFFVFQVLLEQALQNLELIGPMVFLSESIRAIITQYYDEAAFTCLFFFWGLAFQCYMKDRKRFYEVRW